MKYHGQTNSMSERASPKQSEFTETDVWTHLKIEGISRSMVSRSDIMINNGYTVNQKLKFDPIQYKPQAKKEQERRK